MFFDVRGEKEREIEREREKERERQAVQCPSSDPFTAHLWGTITQQKDTDIIPLHTHRDIRTSNPFPLPFTP